MTRQFNTLDELQRFLTRPDNIEKMFKSPQVKKVLSNTMSKAVNDVVYNVYSPAQYKRRRDNGGLGDTKNMDFTKVEIQGNNVILLFENLTMGQSHQLVYNLSVDTLHGEFITDTIIEGIEDNWTQTGEWSKPRDFISETIRNIQSNPAPLIKAIKDGMRKSGFDVK